MTYILIPYQLVVIMEIARQHKLLVVEDACQAWLAEYDNRKVGTMGRPDVSASGIPSILQLE